MPKNQGPIENSPRYEGIAEELRRYIKTAGFQPGDRLPSLRILSRQHGVALGTVDKAQSLLESEGLIVRSERSGAFVAHPAQKTRSGLIGFCGVGFTRTDFSPYWTHLMEGVEAAARQYHSRIVLLSDDSAAGWDKVDGVLANGPHTGIPSSLLMSNLPLVSLFAPVRVSVVVPEVVRPSELEPAPFCRTPP